MFIGYVIPLGVNSQKSRVLAMPGACTTGKTGLALQRGADTGASRAWALWTPSYEGQRGKLGRRAAPVTSSVPLLLTHGRSCEGGARGPDTAPVPPSPQREFGVRRPLFRKDRRADLPDSRGRDLNTSARVWKPRAAPAFS